jgi:energy-coupling factor transporter ATP-binding protein EcfA2
MINGITNVAVESTAMLYPSLLELKETHSRLRKLHKEGATPTLLDEVETFIQRGSATGAILDNDDDRRITQSYLDYWVTILYRAKRTPSDATVVEFDPSLALQLDDSMCPYRGLNAFQESDRNVFFGRERLIETITGALAETRLLAVVGPSGSGKSSIVLAGLLPALKNGVVEGSENWQYFPPMVPGSNPLRNLALAIKLKDPLTTSARHQNTADFLAKQIQSLREDHSDLARTVKNLSDMPAVIVVDQFEEVFTLCADEQLRSAFVENLVNLAQAPDSKHVVILTLRSDWETQIVSFPELMHLFERGHIRVTPLTSGDLYQTIEEPAKRVGLRFEDGVVDALVKDILGEAAGLPLLQFALLRLWKMRNHNRITWPSYKSLGNARRALALTADEFYQGLIPQDQPVVKRILLRLARPTEGFEVTSNRVRRQTLDLAGDTSEAVDRALNKLVGAGLVRLTRGEIPADDQVEVAHEALIRNWPTLVGWLEDERVRLRKRLRLSAVADQWVESGRDPGGLMGGSLLHEALEYKDLNEPENEFIRASQAAIEMAATEKEEIRQRELDLEREKVQALQERNGLIVRHARRTRLFAVVFALVALSSMGFAGIAIKQRRQESTIRKLAEDSRQQAQASATQASEAKRLAEQRNRIALEKAKLLEQAYADLQQQKTKASQEEKTRMGLLIRLAELKAADARKAVKEAVEEKDRANQEAWLSNLARVETDATLLERDNQQQDALEIYTLLARYYGASKMKRNQRRVLGGMQRIYHAQGDAPKEKQVQEQMASLPTPIGEALAKSIQDQGVELAVSRYHELKRTEPNKYDFAEDELNSLGYKLLRGNKVKDAIEVFKLNVEAYRDSYNTYDSLAEAYMIDGNHKELAIWNCRRSLELNPKNTHATEMLRAMGK